MGIIVASTSPSGDSRPLSYHRVTVDRWDFDKGILRAKVFVYVNITKRLANVNLYDFYRIEATTADYDIYLDEAALIGAGKNPQIQLYTWLKTIDPLDGNYPNWQFDYKNDGYLSLKTRQLQYFTWQDNDIIYNETNARFEQYDSGTQTWSEYVFP